MRLSTKPASRRPAVGAKLLFPNGTVQHAGVVIGQDRWPHNLYTGFPASTRRQPLRLPAVTAACMLVRRDAFEPAGGFDPAFLNGYEDVDLCLRLGEEGHESATARGASSTTSSR